MKINEDFLREEGFVDSGRDILDRIIWRKPLHDDRGFFNFTIGEYDESNPNVGVLGIYYPEEEVNTIPKDLINKEDWTEEEKIRAYNHTIKVPSSLQNIVFWLDDQDRFKRLIEDISYSREFIPKINKQ